MKIKDFEEKIVYITGGSSGIGLEIGKLLAAQGAHIYIFARNLERLTSALDVISQNRRYTSQCFEYKQLDVSRYEEVKEVLSSALHDFGVPDVLINSAGKAIPEYHEKISFRQFDDTMKVNLYGTWNTINVLVPFMKKKGGFIINVSSMVGLIPFFGYTDYAAAKAAIIAFSDALRFELRPAGIHIAVLIPTDTNTPGYHQENIQKPPETRALSNFDVIAEPEFIAKMLLKGLKRGKFLIIPVFRDRLLFLAKRIIRPVMDFVINSTVQKTQKALNRIDFK